MPKIQPAWWFATALTLGACGGGSEGTGETAGSSTTADSTAQGGSSGPTTSTTTDGADTTTGAESGLVPCDPLADDCAPLRCGGAATAGFYCRPPCSAMAESGDPCSDGGVCLEAAPGSPDKVCVVIQSCEPSTGDGCDLGAGESCVVVDLEPLRTACEPAGNGGVADPCGPAGGNECSLGLGCLGSDLQDGDPGYCTPWCAPPGDGGPECVVCVPISEGIGSCAECGVLDDNCPAGSQCQPINEALGGLCIEYGPGGEDEPCSPVDPTQSCQQGLVCLELYEDDVFSCVSTCDPAAPVCDDPEKSCIDIGAILPGVPTGEIGLCLPGVQQFCDPQADPNGCDPGDVCLTVGEGVGVCGAVCDPTLGDAACPGNAACFPEAEGMINITPFAVGNGACGQGCVDDGDCAGGTCLLVEGLASAGVCGASCDPAAPVCDPGSSCVATPADPLVGACILGGGSCDPADALSCLGMSETSCVTIEGGADAVCMAGCFQQDPNGCGGMAALCQVRTDEAFHAGVCVGQEPPCDPLMQDCDDGQTCVVTGGGALGGTAFVCRDAGPLGDGADCAADDGACGLGLQCIGDVCAALCDPQADDCAQGTCMDAAGLLYLPVGTLGFCL